MLATTVGAALGSRRELAGQWARLRVLMGLSAAGGLLGAGLLLITDAATFEAVVPWLVGLGGVLLLARDRLRSRLERRRAAPTNPTRRVPHTVLGALLIVIVGVYGGYFGAGVGIIFLTVLALQGPAEPLAVTNAVKNVASGTANVVASTAYVFVAPVDWPSVVALSAGALIGSWIGPAAVRVTPEKPLRWAIGLCGLGLAAWLALS